MSNVPPAAIVNAQNAQKKHFLSMPAPLGYVAGVGRGATGKIRQFKDQEQYSLKFSTQIRQIFTTLVLETS